MTLAANQLTDAKMPGLNHIELQPSYNTKMQNNSYNYTYMNKTKPYETKAWFRHLQLFKVQGKVVI